MLSSAYESSRAGVSTLPRIGTHSGAGSLTEWFQDPIKPAHLAKAVTEKTKELFHAGAVSPKGCDDA
jgi:hypothetical protein